MGIHNRVREVRLRRGLTISQVAAALRMSRQTIYSLEGDPKYRPSVAMMDRLATHLQVGLDELLGIERVA